MKVTRYFQSCLLIETGKARILIDPSDQEKERMSDFGKLDAVFYTHEHSDHFDAGMAQAIVEQGIAPVYANASTAKQIAASKTIIEDGKEYDVSGIKVKAIELPHCLMVDGSQGPQNTGLLINGELFHPGDGKELADLKVDNLALPIIGPDVSPKEAFDFAKQVSAKKAIPIHYDSWGALPGTYARIAEIYKIPLEMMILDHSQSVEL